MLIEQKLSQEEILGHRNLTLKVVNHTCSYSPWNQIISHVNLFGSLGRNSGQRKSDVDVAFFSNPEYRPNREDYVRSTDFLVYQINVCREIYFVEFLINPILVLLSWDGIDANSHPRKEVIKAANEGNRIWPI